MKYHDFDFFRPDGGIKLLSKTIGYVNDGREGSTPTGGLPEEIPAGVQAKGKR